jgi:polysaccharide export outer membrane protein
LQDRPQLNIRLQPDDIITLDLSPQNYTVLGAATSEASKPLPGAGLTLAEVIGQAGGLDDGRADSKGIYVLRHEHRSLLRSLGVTIPAAVAHAERVPTIYQFDMDSIDGIFAAQAYSIRANDIVLIANAQSVDLTKAFRLLTGATQQVSSTTTLANRL